MLLLLRSPVLFRNFTDSQARCALGSGRRSLKGVLH